MTDSTILTSGAPLEWPQYTGGQRRSILYAAVYEGLADSVAAAENALDSGRIVVHSTQQHNCIGSVAGIYTASMPVLVVRDETHGGTAFCNLYEGKSRHRLNYGSYNDEVRDGLQWLENIMAPVLATALELHGPIPLKPIMTTGVAPRRRAAQPKHRGQHDFRARAHLVVHQDGQHAQRHGGVRRAGLLPGQRLHVPANGNGCGEGHRRRRPRRGRQHPGHRDGDQLPSPSPSGSVGSATSGSPAPTPTRREVLRRLRPGRRRMDRWRELLHRSDRRWRVRAGGSSRTAGVPGRQLRPHDGQQPSLYDITLANILNSPSPHWVSVAPRWAST